MADDSSKPLFSGLLRLREVVIVLPAKDYKPRGVMMQYLPRFFRSTQFALTSALLGSVAAAHPGHGVDPVEAGFFHYLLSPTHMGVAMLLLAAVVIAGVGLARSLRGFRFSQLGK